MLILFMLLLLHMRLFPVIIKMWCQDIEVQHFACSFNIYGCLIACFLTPEWGGDEIPAPKFALQEQRIKKFSEQTHYSAGKAVWDGLDMGKVG